MTQEFFMGDYALLEIQTGTFCKVQVIVVKNAYGHVRYVVSTGYGKQMTVEKLSKIPKK